MDWFLGCVIYALMNWWVYWWICLLGYAMSALMDWWIGGLVGGLIGGLVGGLSGGMCNLCVDGVWVGDLLASGVD